MLITIKAVNQWLQKSQMGLGMQEKQTLATVTQKLSANMNDPKTTSIRMVEGPLKDASGTIKMALFSKDPFYVEVQRSQWKVLDQTDRFVLMGLELFGLADIPDRYSLAENIKNQSTILSTIRGDLQLFSFIVGSWKLVDGSCLSGIPVNWGSDPSEVVNYQMRFKFNADSTGESELLYKGAEKVTSKIHFLIQKANLVLTTLETCQQESGQKICETDLAEESNFFLSIQGDQLWMLSNQGDLGGSCGSQDIFVMKLSRQ